MNVILPNPNSPIGVILDTIRRALIPAVSQDEAAARVLLRSPNGTVFSVTVSDAGIISTAVIDGKSRPY
jgi:hypothetical protein